jgi:hypothetical protein
MRDVNGTELRVGDHVVVEGVIKSANPTDEYCNVQIETDEPMYPGDSKSTLWLNAKQVTLCRRAK